MAEKQEAPTRSFDEKSLEDGTATATHVDHHVTSGHAQPAVKVSQVEEDPSKAYVERFGRFGGFLDKLFASGVEARGIERVPEDQRDPRRLWNK
jgi:hypothetical protein